ncbi:5-bromo-4-chloroindolyl phosphate hydrolysis protein [Bacillus pakistanensis]|uniref:5-bromo-4-chloroindolyl phosphate hydrolysis protein n=1 Tax=Rossellomorea pakistanensis TaxID=992288 RepID=A0ABS2N8D3_9BACI|nr:5-bromo-4-chloroindolyl phosphate hydrolysis family protein [Bacillus pakistanensis]MBM7584118.1 5-bromo-4-chloroindolyl phosphate hydrolysis protein [Bacillus pakistanensis]
MKKLSFSIIRFLLAFSVTMILFLSLIISGTTDFWFSLLIGILGGVLSSLVIKWCQLRLFLKKCGLNYKEYIYIQKNLKEAKIKIKRLQKTQFKVRSLGAFKQIFELNRLSKRIFTIVTKQPNKYYQCEQFFFHHLDSAVELSEKYTFLSTQPLKEDHVVESLTETKKTLQNLNQSLNDDLLKVLSEDIDTLNFELDVAKRNNNLNIPK